MDDSASGFAGVARIRLQHRTQFPTRTAEREQGEQRLRVRLGIFRFVIFKQVAYIASHWSRSRWHAVGQQAESAEWGRIAGHGGTDGAGGDTFARRAHMRHKIDSCPDFVGRNVNRSSSIKLRLSR